MPPLAPSRARTTPVTAQPRTPLSGSERRPRDNRRPGLTSWSTASSPVSRFGPAPPRVPSPPPPHWSAQSTLRAGYAEQPCWREERQSEQQQQQPKAPGAPRIPRRPTPDSRKPWNTCGGEDKKEEEEAVAVAPPMIAGCSSPA
ncbi:hypothetical protein SPI_02355 [Niveomyces insectorum RCEF 264]|uniref:Uncharacterized protein n=1 Tax=Niveomyces insectorum RCEF 264 TaxID=1081102 RepID=A0A162KBC0_9HYPO|nr:hypothetical protein SPI_02355 [Niveomyces insectorum RCEF 264]